MNIDTQFRFRLKSTFGPLSNKPAAGAFPSTATLASSLPKLYARPAKYDNGFKPQFFGTAAVEIWHRSVHSFLISISLTNASPIWASVIGYYSSHYTVRGIAHLLGYFYLFGLRKTAYLEFPRRRLCKVSFLEKPKGISRGGEHQLYWHFVKHEPTFRDNPLFTENSQVTDISDCAHRNYANYIDHVCRYPVFHPLDKNVIKERIDKISRILFDAPPIPNRSNFPDIDAVQLIAYHRIVTFRKILDEVLGNDNRFWHVHRTPSFADPFMDYQLTERNGLTEY